MITTNDDTIEANFRTYIQHRSVVVTTQTSHPTLEEALHVFLFAFRRHYQQVLNNNISNEPPTLIPEDDDAPITTTTNNNNNNNNYNYNIHHIQQHNTKICDSFETWIRSGNGPRLTDEFPSNTIALLQTNTGWDDNNNNYTTHNAQHNLLLLPDTFSTLILVSREIHGRMYHLYQIAATDTTTHLPLSDIIVQQQPEIILLDYPTTTTTTRTPPSPRSDIQPLQLIPSQSNEIPESIQPSSPSSTALVRSTTETMGTQPPPPVNTRSLVLPQADAIQVVPQQQQQQRSSRSRRSTPYSHVLTTRHDNRSSDVESVSRTTTTQNPPPHPSQVNTTNRQTSTNDFKVNITIQNMNSNIGSSSTTNTTTAPPPAPPPPFAPPVSKINENRSASTGDSSINMRSSSNISTATTPLASPVSQTSANTQTSLNISDHVRSTSPQSPWNDMTGIITQVYESGFYEVQLDNRSDDKPRRFITGLEKIHHGRY